MFFEGKISISAYFCLLGFLGHFFFCNLAHLQINQQGGVLISVKFDRTHTNKGLTLLLSILSPAGDCFIMYKLMYNDHQTTVKSKGKLQHDSVTPLTDRLLYAGTLEMWHIQSESRSISLSRTMSDKESLSAMFVWRHTDGNSHNTYWHTWWQKRRLQ